MEKLSLSDEIELEANRLLCLRKSTIQVAKELTEFVLRKSQQNKKNLLECTESVAAFFLSAGLCVELNSFITECLENKIPIPWGHFCESIFRSSALVSEKIKSALIEGAEHNQKLGDLSRSEKLDYYDEKLASIRSERVNVLSRNRELQKKSLLSDYQTLKAQGLDQDAKELLDKLRRYYSDDLSLETFFHSHIKIQKAQLRPAPKIPEKSGPYIPIEIYQELDPETKQIFSCILQSVNGMLSHKYDPDLAYDFMIMEIFFENYIDALSLSTPFSNPNSNTHKKISMNRLWLRFEILFQCRKYIELLEEIKNAEKIFKNEPDVLIALEYIKAQCYWELEETSLAIQMMESILHIRPHYRSAAILLHEWKSGNA